MSQPTRILLVEDHEAGARLTREEPGDSELANEIVIAKDGLEVDLEPLLNAVHAIEDFWPSIVKRPARQSGLPPRP